MRTIGSILALGLAIPALAADWPQYLGTQRDGVWREEGILEKFPEGGPKLKWKAAIGYGYAGPAVAAGRVFVHDRVLAAGTENPGSGFAKGSTKGNERVVAFDEATGKVLWTHEYPTEYRIQYAAGPRATPTVDGNRVYAYGAMGDLRALEADSGKLIWSKNMVTDYAARINIWGFAAAPLIEGNQLIVLAGGSNDRTVISFDKSTGKELWASQGLESDAGYSPPVIYELAGKRTLVIWHGRGVVGLDPETGKRLWYHAWPVQYALTAPLPRALPGDRLFLPAFYEGPLMLRISSGGSPEVAWKSKSKGEKPGQSDGLHSIMPTPFFVDGYLYGVSSYGELLCQNAETGETMWKTRKPTVGTPTEEGPETRWGNAFLTQNGNRFFLFNEKGELVISRLTPKGYEEIDRAKLIAPTNKMAGRPVVWTHPAYANKSIYVRNDAELAVFDLGK